MRKRMRAAHPFASEISKGGCKMYICRRRDIKKGGKADEGKEQIRKMDRRR